MYDIKAKRIFHLPTGKFYYGFKCKNCNIWVLFDEFNDYGSGKSQITVINCPKCNMSYKVIPPFF